MIVKHQNGGDVDELSVEELEDAAGGLDVNVSCPTTTNSSQCQCTATQTKVAAAVAAE